MFISTLRVSDGSDVWWRVCVPGMRYASDTKRIRSVMASSGIDSEESEDVSCDEA